MQFDQLDRRGFLTLLGGAAAWPLAARAQQGERVRRIGVLAGDTQNDPENKARLAGFRQELERLGWSEGRNGRIEYRLAANNPDQYQPLAKELVSLQPDVFLAYTTPVAAAFRQCLRSGRLRSGREPGAAGRQSHGFPVAGDPVI
jgi:DNA-binding LacI/PurR family transcriptional regulator